MSVTAKRREEQRLALWDKWIDGINEEIARGSIGLSKFGRYGEEVYNGCFSLISAYKETAAIYDAERENIITSAVRDILEGIYSILSSRIRQFEDAAQQENVNPIACENIAVCKSVLDTVNTGDARERYVESVKLCAAALNDLSRRPIMQSYIDMALSEWDVMSSIVRIQVNALEASLPFASDNEQITVNNILTVLRESYQRFGRTVTELNDILRGDGTSFSEINIPEEFPLSPLFYSALKQEAFAVADKTRVTYVRAAYRFQRMFSEESHLAGDIINLFENLYKTMPDSSFLPAEMTTQKAIISGVCETVEIKIESLRESAAYFTESGKQLIKNFAVDRKALSEEELEVFYSNATKLWLEEVSEHDEQEIPAYFSKLENDELLMANSAYNEKRINEYTEKTEKALLRFKKETLLYEICTYEEILTHSVSRLRDCAAETVVQTVELLDETFAALEVLLKKNNIEVIHPQPHQMFNGREHEVLVAETQEGFCKGEIIKTINSGYKQKDLTILRANVVAAR